MTNLITLISRIEKDTAVEKRIKQRLAQLEAALANED